MKNRFITQSSGSFFLFGPRGTGKSTWLEAALPEAYTVNLLLADVRRQLTGNPERLHSIVAEHPDKSVFVIDEIQRVPDLLDSVHDIMEKSPHLKFVLTGSSARKLKRAGKDTDMLGGRAVKRTCHPFMAAEMGMDFNLADALRLGMIPLVRYPRNNTSEEVLGTYLDVYLQEEIVNEGLVRKLDDFARFLEMASFSHGAILSMSDIAREAEVKRSTVDGYFSILESLMVAYRLPVFTKRARRQLVGHDKFYLFDAGVYRTLRPKGPLDRPEEIDGAALEGLVHQHLRAWLDYSLVRGGLYFWRTRAGTEVDFVVYTDNGFWAIEVKNAKKVSGGDFSGLKAFHEDYPEAKTILLYRGEESKVQDGTMVLPVEKFLQRLRPGAPLVE